MGKETLGRIINVIGEPVDEQGPVSESSPPFLQCTCTSYCKSSRALTKHYLHLERHEHRYRLP